MERDRIRKETVEHVSQFKKEYRDRVIERFCDEVSDSEINEVGMLLHKHKACATSEEIDILVYMQRDSSIEIEGIIRNLAKCNNLAEALALYIAF